MTPIKLADTVGDVVTRFPTLSRVFEQKGIDYCCGEFPHLDEMTAKVASVHGEKEPRLHQHIHKENNVLFPRAIESTSIKCV